MRADNREKPDSTHPNLPLSRRFQSLGGSGIRFTVALLVAALGGSA